MFTLSPSHRTGRQMETGGKIWTDTRIRAKTWLSEFLCTFFGCTPGEGLRIDRKLDAGCLALALPETSRKPTNIFLVYEESRWASTTDEIRPPILRWLCIWPERLFSLPTANTENYVIGELIDPNGMSASTKRKTFVDIRLFVLSSQKLRPHIEIAGIS